MPSRHKGMCLSQIPPMPSRHKGKCNYLKRRQCRPATRVDLSLKCRQRRPASTGKGLTSNAVNAVPPLEKVLLSNAATAVSPQRHVFIPNTANAVPPQGLV